MLNVIYFVHFGKRISDSMCFLLCKGKNPIFEAV